MASTWSTDLAFLAACARTEIDSATAQRIEDLVGRVSWPEVLRLGRFHRVLPLLYQSTKSICGRRVPEDIASALHRNYVATAASNLRLVHEMHTVDARLRDHGVRALFFKGAVLAQDAYRNLALRACSDIDLYISRHQFEGLERCLRELGYRPVKAVDEDGEVDSTVLDITGQCPFVHPQHTCSLDVHTALMPPGYTYGISFDALYSRRIPVRVDGADVSTFSTEDRLQILCLHGAKNRWEALKHVSDVAEVLRSHPEINWQDVLATARSVHGERILYVGLLLARRLLDAPLPSFIERDIETHSRVTALVEEIEAYLSYSDTQIIQGKDRLQFHLKIQDTLRARAKYGMYVVRRRLRDVSLR